LTTPLPPSDPVKLKILQGIDEINRHNAGIKNMFCTKVDVSMQQNFGMSLSGVLAYEKDKCFRLQINSRFSKEIDIGSNNTIFWFWSKRLEKSALYWTEHENVYKSRLKPLFHPLWIMESMGLERINAQESEVSEFEGKWRVMQKKKSTLGYNVIKTILIDPVNKRVVGHYISSLNGQLIATTEIEEWRDGLPYKLNMIWHEENTSVRLTLRHTKQNVVIESLQFEKPNIQPQINMAED
jgi:hypothetical protein